MKQLECNFLINLLDICSFEHLVPLFRYVIWQEQTFENYILSPDIKSIALIKIFMIRNTLVNW